MGMITASQTPIGLLRRQTERLTEPQSVENLVLEETRYEQSEEIENQGAGCG